MNRKPYYNRDPRNRDPHMRDRDRDRDWDRGRSDYRSRPPARRSRSPLRHDDKRRSRSPRKEKDGIDDNILSEISKLPEPSELWETQFQDASYPGPPPPAPSFQPEYGSNYQPSYSGLYGDFPTAPPPPEMSQWNQMSLPPPPASTAPPTFVNPEEQMKKDAAIETEMRHQKAALSKQREDYIKKAGVLKKELDTLKDQRTELRGDSKRSPSPDTKRFLKENTKLQLEIQNKLKTINNVVDMLNGIIGEEAPPTVETADSDDSTETAPKRKSRSPSANRKFNYVYYDPEMHWCRVCNEFPPTAKDYLNHLHSAAHQKMAAAHMEAPWHSIAGANEGKPTNPAAPTKRTPIRGLQFFVPSTAWYCKLCDQFIGDLHCASAHLKSLTHSDNYTNFVEQNPHWETDWMSDRQKAFEKCRTKPKPQPEVKPHYVPHTITFNKDGVAKRNKESPPPVEVKKKKKEKKIRKKKKSSSSSSSDSDSSDSEVIRKKKKKKLKVPASTDDKQLSEWMSGIHTEGLSDSDRRLLDTLRARMKMEKPAEAKPRSPPRERVRSDSIARKRELERQSRARETRERERERERERDRRRSPPREVKKPEIKKMPFIGKMPVYKSLTKTKTEEQKKEEEKKKEEEEATKKRREEMDVEIQKKVAEFKEKIAKAQLERCPLPPPAVVLPTALGAPITPVQPLQPLLPNPPKPAAPALPKDFQEALDIIFPSAEVKAAAPSPDLFGLPPGFPMGLGGVMPSFPPFLQPQMPQNMFNTMFDINNMNNMNNMNNNMFQPQRPQIYDNINSMSLLGKRPPNKPNNNKFQNKKNYNNKNNTMNKNSNQNQNKNQNQSNASQNQIASEKKEKELKANGEAARKKEEMEDMAMLGIDAGDVGAGM